MLLLHFHSATSGRTPRKATPGQDLPVAAGFRSSAKQTVATLRPRQPGCWGLVGLQYIAGLQRALIVGKRQLHIEKFDRNTRTSQWIWTVANLEMQMRLCRSPSPGERAPRAHNFSAPEKIAS